MKFKLTTTLNKLLENNACSPSYEKLIEFVGLNYNKDKPINLLTILESNGVSDMLWCLRATIEDPRHAARLIVADMAESVLYLYQLMFNSNAPRAAINACRNFNLNDEALISAADAADDAAGDADAFAAHAAHAAAYAAYAAAFADNADHAAACVAGAADYAARAAVDSADSSAYAACAAGDDEMQKQIEIIKRYLLTDNENEEILKMKVNKDIFDLSDTSDVPGFEKKSIKHKILELFKIKSTLTVDELIVGHYRTYKKLYTRSAVYVRADRLVRIGLLKREGRGVYSIVKTGDENV